MSKALDCKTKERESILGPDKSAWIVNTILALGIVIAIIGAIAIGKCSRRLHQKNEEARAKLNDEGYD